MYYEAIGWWQTSDGSSGGLITSDLGIDTRCETLKMAFRAAVRLLESARQESGDLEGQYANYGVEYIELVRVDEQRGQLEFETVAVFARDLSRYGRKGCHNHPIQLLS
mgnify:FL=1